MLNSCDAVILAGGEGTRIRHLLPEGWPKIMADVNGEPFVDIMIRHLRDKEFVRLILAGGYGQDALSNHLVEKYIGKRGENIRQYWSTGGKGTAGAVAWVRGGIKSDPFFIVNGDTYCDVDYAAMLDYHLESKSVITVAHDDRMRHVGTFVASRRLVDLIPETDGKYDMEELFTLLGKRHEPVGLFRTGAEFHDIGTEEGLREFRHFWTGQITGAAGSKGA